MRILCPYCDNEADIEALHDATEVWGVELGDSDGLAYDYITTYHDDYPDPLQGDLLQCSECQAIFDLDEAIALLKAGIASD